VKLIARKILPFILLYWSYFGQAQTQPLGITFGGQQEDQGIVVKNTSDGNLLVIGFSSGFSGNSDIYLIKTDLNGKLKMSFNFSNHFRNIFCAVKDELTTFEINESKFIGYCELTLLHAWEKYLDNGSLTFNRWISFVIASTQHAKVYGFELNRIQSLGIPFTESKLTRVRRTIKGERV